MKKDRVFRTMEHCKGMHDVRHQQSIPHSTGEGTVFQKLDRMAREKERLLARAALWASKLRREEERIAELDRQREILLTSLEPLIREAEEEVPYALPLPG